MSSSTPNIGLTLPIGTEHVSRQIINDNMTKIDTAFGNMSKATMRDVPFAVAVADWTASGDDWVAEFATTYVTGTSKEFGFYDTDSMTQYAKAVIDLAKKPGGGAIVFTTAKKPTGTITGTLYVWDSDDGKIPVIIENTVVPIENGGTNASNLVGAKQNLGIADCESDINTLSEAITNINNRFTTKTSGSLHDITASGIYYLTGGVTDKPVANGGIYVVACYNSDLMVGFYCSTDGYAYSVIHTNNNWYTYRLANQT